MQRKGHFAILTPLEKILPWKHNLGHIWSLWVTWGGLSQKFDILKLTFSDQKYASPDTEFELGHYKTVLDTFILVNIGYWEAILCVKKTFRCMKMERGHWSDRNFWELFETFRHWNRSEFPRPYCNVFYLSKCYRYTDEAYWIKREIFVVYIALCS